MKIAIVFGDNDYYNTHINLMKLLNDAIQWTDELPTDKDKLCFLLNDLSAGMYMLFQHTSAYNSVNFNEVYSHSSEYLSLKPSDILFDEEVDEYCNRVGDGNGNSSTYILDSEIYTNGIKTGYVWCF